MIGPKCSGKSELGRALAERTNMTMFNFPQFLRQSNLKGKDDETVTMALIDRVRELTSPRLLIEDFPQNEFQAKFFIKNCIHPTEVFMLNCSKDVCQERMLDLGRNHPQYLASALLSKKIAKYHANLPQLHAFLKSKTNLHEINSERHLANVFKDLSAIIEPVVVHVRCGGSSNELRKEIVEKLQTEEGFFNIEVTPILRLSSQRQTTLGNEFTNIIKSGKNLPADVIVRLLRTIIYSGLPNQKKFILSAFPDIIEQAQEFEKSCATITAIIYATSDDPVVEIKGNNLTLFNIDALFQKEFRLKTMSEWDSGNFNEMLGSKVDYLVVTGRSLSGKSAVC